MIPKLKCYRCKKEWPARTDSPKKCPYCQSRHWSDPDFMKEQKCLNCKKTWSSKINPKKCPHCQSRHWNDAEYFKRPILALMLFLFIIPYVSASAQNIPLLFNISNYQAKICYNGADKNFTLYDCYNIDLNSYNLSLNTSLSDSIEIPQSNSTVQCEVLDKWIEISVNPPSVNFPNITSSCNPTLVCPSASNVSCDPTLTCPPEDKTAENNCISQLGIALNGNPNQPPASSLSLPDNYGTIGIILALILFGVIAYFKFVKKDKKKGEDEDYAEERFVIQNSSPPPQAMRPPRQQPQTYIPPFEFQSPPQVTPQPKVYSAEPIQPPLPSKPTTEEEREARIKRYKEQILRSKE